jgi:hypothetical protein
MHSTAKFPLTLGKDVVVPVNTLFRSFNCDPATVEDNLNLLPEFMASAGPAKCQFPTSCLSAIENAPMHWLKWNFTTLPHLCRATPRFRVYCNDGSLSQHHNQLQPPQINCVSLFHSGTNPQVCAKIPPTRTSANAPQCSRPQLHLPGPQGLRIPRLIVYAHR